MSLKTINQDEVKKVLPHKNDYMNTKDIKGAYP